jgi:2'-5' RNA ligase
VNLLEIQDAFIQTKTEILSQNYSKNNIEDLFMSPSILHITLLTLDLKDENRLKEAKSLMKELRNEIKEKVLKGQHISLTLTGLATFNYLSPTTANVLYCEIKNDESYLLLKKLTSKQHLNDIFMSIGKLINEFISKKLISQDEV